METEKRRLDGKTSYGAGTERPTPLKCGHSSFNGKKKKTSDRFWLKKRLEKKFVIESKNGFD